jgi:glutaredoxin-like protein
LANALRLQEGDKTRLFQPDEEVEIKKRQDVKLTLFTQTLNCGSCPETAALLKAVAELSDRLKLDIYNLQVDREKAESYKITRVPALIIEGDRDYGIRYYGIPGGYEFASLLEDIVSIGKRESGLSDASKEKVRTLTEPLNLKVFVTPT